MYRFVLVVLTLVEFSFSCQLLDSFSLFNLCMSSLFKSIIYCIYQMSCGGPIHYCVSMVITVIGYGFIPNSDL